MQVAFRFGHSQVQHEFRPWINGRPSAIPTQENQPPGPARLPDGTEHGFWIISNNIFFDPKRFTHNEQGKGWLNEVEGLINQKLPQADLRIENVLTNELFLEHNFTQYKIVGGIRSDNQTSQKLNVP